MLLILTSAVTSRLDYIARFVCTDLLGFGVTFTTSADEFAAWPGPRINYRPEPFAGSVHVVPHTILFEKGITSQEIRISAFRGVTVFFQTGGEERDASVDTVYSGHTLATGAVPGRLPFDIFAASFWLISRYEEYLPHQEDQNGRFRHESGLAFTAGCLDKPLIHFWSEILGEMLLGQFPGLKLRKAVYRFVPTIDIDHAYAYLCRSPARTLGGIGNSLLKGHPDDILMRFKVLTGISRDPYDNYEFLEALHKRMGNHPQYFILFASYGGDDNNVTLDSPRFRELLKSIDSHGQVGIHPSLASNDDFGRLTDEYNGLIRVLGRKVTASRQHFLKFTFPDTYRRLIELGITDDYSMGYASTPGFRAGCALPFKFYDLTADQLSGLTIHPVTMMDVTLRDYLRLNPDQSLEMIRNQVNILKSAGGHFVSLWHNESLGDHGKWQGWRKVYEKMVELASI